MTPHVPSRRLASFAVPDDAKPAARLGPSARAKVRLRAVHKVLPADGDAR